MKKLLIFLFCLPVIAGAQSSLPKNVNDSLWNIWNDNDQADTIRLKALKHITLKGYLFSMPDSAFFFAQKLYDFAEKKGNKNFMAEALNLQGISYGVRGDNTNAINLQLRCLEIRKESDDQIGMANALTNIGLSYYMMGEYDRSIANHKQSLEISKKLNNKPGIANSLLSMGIVYYTQGNYAKAIEYYSLSLKNYEKAGDQDNVVKVLNNIGLIYKEQGNYNKAIEYYERCIVKGKESGNKIITSLAFGNLGVVYNELVLKAISDGNDEQTSELFSKAVFYHTESKKLCEETGDKAGTANALNNIGLINYQIGNYTEAKEFYLQSLKLYEEIGKKQGLANTLTNIGNCFLKEENYLKSLEYGQKAYIIAKEINAANELKGASYSLWKTYSKLGKFKEGLEMYELYISTRDSIESEENQKEVIRQEYKYQYEKQSAADSIKTTEEKKVKDAQIAQQDAEIKAKNNQQYMLFGGLGLVLIFAVFMYNRFKITQQQKGIIEEQKHIVEEKNKEITDSINYAKRIQTAILPPDKIVKEHLSDSFILYKPKDIVAGDFYWLETVLSPSGGGKGEDRKVLFAACDCTGHGVPGAMVSVVCNNSLNRAVREFGLTDPGKILDKTRELVIQEFEKSEEEVKDGMDISLCCLEFRVLSSELKANEQPETMNHKLGTVKWAGANNPLWLIRSCPPPEGVAKPGEENEYTLIEYKPNKQPIGKYADPKPFTTHEIELQKGDTIYIFTDGFQDQFGGDPLKAAGGKKLKTKPFKELLLSVQDKSMEEQRKIIDEAFEKWKGDFEQNDDVCVIGVRV